MALTHRAILTLLALLPLVAACEGTNNSGFGEPVIFPQYARLGDQVAMVIDSNYGLNHWNEQYDLTADTVEIDLYDPADLNTVIATLDNGANGGIDGVFSIRPSATSKLGLEQQPGNKTTLVVFQLPDSLSHSQAGSPPYDVFVEVRKLNFPEPIPAYSNTVTIVPGGPDPLIDLHQNLADLAPMPGVRLVPIPLDFGGFDEAWTIGAVEFTVTIDDAKIDNMRVAPATFAERATTLSVLEQQVGGFSSYRVMLLHLNGFNVKHVDCGTASPYCATQGPMIDLVFNRIATFDETAIALSDLEVYGLDGTAHVQLGANPADYFEKVVVENVEPGP